MSFFKSEEITYKPPYMSLMGRMLFHIQDTAIDEYFPQFPDRIVNYDRCSGKYRIARFCGDFKLVNCRIFY